MSPRTKEQFAEIRKQSSELIAQSALELFAYHGFHRTSIEQIAKKAGVSKGLIYNYFATKDDLLRHIVESAIEVGENLMHEADHQLTDPAAKILRIMDDLFELLKKNTNYWKLLMMLSMQQEIAKKFEAVINQHAMKSVGQLAGLLEQLGVQNHEMEALSLAAMFDGMTLHYIYMGDQYPLDEVLEHLKCKIDLLKRNDSG